MNSVPYVSDPDLDEAKEIENRLLAVPKEFGLLFVSVEPVPVSGGRSRIFTVHVGISRKFDEDAGRMVVSKTLADGGYEEERGIVFSVNIYRGVSSDQASAGTRSPTT